MVAYIYIIECEDGSLYTGIAKDIRKRMKQHVNTTASKYTRSKKIRELRCLWKCDSYSDAAKLEYAIKSLTREKKLTLIQDGDKVREFFPKLEDVCYEKLPLFDIWEDEKDI